MTIGDAIRFARESKNWSQGDLAQRAGIHRVTVCRIERGRLGLTVGTQRLCAVLGLSLDALVKTSGSRRKSA
jgi:transcriptional regulator with XRE-family HTH domain